MKIYKIIVGIVLFATPITFHASSGHYMMHAPIGSLNFYADTVSFSVHNFKLYTTYGAEAFLFDIDTYAEDDMLCYFTEHSGSDRVLALEGIMTIIILWGLAVYIIASIIDQKILNIISDIVMIGFAIISLLTFLEWNKSLWTMWADFGIPIFTIIAGLLGIGGLIHSSMNLKK